MREVLVASVFYIKKTEQSELCFVVEEGAEIELRIFVPQVHDRKRLVARAKRYERVYK